MEMTEREKLIKLIETGTNLASKKAVEETARIVKENHHYNSATDKTVSISEMLADYLLENGVIVPLINEADTVYVVLLNKVFKFDIISVNIFQNRLIYKGQHGLNLSYTFRPRDIGKTVFLTREEAEKALAERGYK